MNKINNSSNNNSHHERLFWLIFRNIYIKTQIFSNLNDNKILNYDRLIEGEYILNSFSNGIEIIRDKVKCGSYLTKKSLIPVYKLIIKENEENIQFYNQLFQNYPNHFLVLEDITVFLEANNLLAFKLFIKWFKVQDNEEILRFVTPHIKTLEQSYRGIKILNYLIEYYDLELNNTEFLGYRFFYIWLINENHHSLKIKKAFKLIKLLINYKINSSISFYNRIESSSSSNNNNNDDEYFDHVESFLLENSCIGDINSYSDLINEIESYQFNKFQLSSSLFEMLISINYINKNIINYSNNNYEFINQFKNNINNLKSTIFKMIYLFYSVFKKEKRSRINDFKNKIKNKLNNSSIDLFHFSNFLYNFLNNNNNNKNNSDSNNNNNNNNNNSHIISILEYFFKVQFKDFASVQILQVFLEFDNIELIKAIHSDKEIEDLLLPLYLDLNSLRYILSSIKSKEMLEFYFNNYQDLFFKNNNQNWQSVNSLEILEHYELLLGRIGNKFIIKNCETPIDNKSLVLEFLYRVLRGGGFGKIKSYDPNNNYYGFPESDSEDDDINSVDNNSGDYSCNNLLNVYKISSDFNFASLQEIFKYYVLHKSSDIIVSIYELFIVDFIRLPYTSYFSKGTPFVRLIKWIVKNASDEEVKRASRLDLSGQYSELVVSINSKKFSKKKTKFQLSLNQYQTSLIYNNRYREVLEMHYSNPLNLFSSFLVCSTPYLCEFIQSSITYYLELLKKKPASKLHQLNYINKLIKTYLVYSSERSNIEIFKDPNTFKFIASEPLKYADCDSLNKKVLLMEALDSQSIELVDILINNNITISKDEFLKEFSNEIILKTFSKKFK